MKNTALNSILYPRSSAAGNYSGYTSEQLDQMSAAISKAEIDVKNHTNHKADLEVAVATLKNLWGNCDCHDLHNGNCYCKDSAGATVERSYANVAPGRAEYARMSAVLADISAKLAAAIQVLKTLRETYAEAIDQFVKQQEANMTPAQRAELEKQRSENAARLLEVNAMAQNKTIIYIAVGLLVLTVGGIAAWYYFKHRKKG